MIYFISPALGFKAHDENLESSGSADTEPLYAQKVRTIVDTLSSMSVLDLQKTLDCSEELAELNFERYKQFEATTPAQALHSFDGIAYKSLDASTLEADAYAYLCDKLRILSGLYGVLRPSDLICPYRLEMKTKVEVDGAKNLYVFWGDLLYRALVADSDGTIVNLASKEYSQCIEKYLQDETYITCTFKVDKGKGLKVQSTAAKQARGAMIRWVAQNKIQPPEELTAFNVDGYQFEPELSTLSGQKQEYVFAKYVS